MLTVHVPPVTTLAKVAIKLYVPEYNDLENLIFRFCVPPAEIIRSLGNPWFQHVSQIEIELSAIPDQTSLTRLTTFSFVAGRSSGQSIQSDCRTTSCDPRLVMVHDILSMSKESGPFARVHCGVAVAVGVEVEVEVGVDVGVEVRVGVGVRVAPGVGVDVLVGVGVKVKVNVGVGEVVGVRVIVAVCGMVG